MNRSSLLRHLSSDKSAAQYSLFCAGLIIFGVACFICFRTFESAKKNALVADRTAASFLAYFLAEHDKSTLGDLLSYAERPLLIKAVKQKDLATILTHLDGMKRNNPEIDLIFLTDRSATILANYPVFPEAIGQNVSDRDWYQGVSARWQPYTSSIFQLIVADKPLAVAVAVPIKDEKGDIIGVLGNSYRLDFMARIIQNNYLRPDTTMNILDRKGQILFSSKYPFRDKVAEYPLFSFLRQTKEQNGYTMEATETANNEGAVYLTPYSVGSTGWTVVVERTRADILRSVYGSFLEIGGIGALLFSLASIFLFYNRKVFELKTTKEQLVERHKAEEALRESEEKYRALVEAAPDAVIVHREGRFLYANSKALTLYGAETLEQLQSRRVLDLIHPDDQPDIAERMQRGMAGQSLELRETKLVRLDGQVVSVESVGGAITYQGSPAVQIIVRDITARKQAEEKLAIAYRQLQSVIDNTPALVYALDLEERFIMANVAVAELLNSSLEQMIGKKRHEFMPKTDADWHEANDQKVIEAGGALEFEEYSQLKGRSITWLTTKFPLRDTQGKICGVAGISADITTRKQAEAALKEARDSLEQRVLERTMELQNLAEQLEKSRDDLRVLASELVMAEERERKRIAAVLHDDIAQTLAVARMRIDLLQRMANDDESRQTVADAKKFLVQSIRETRALMNDLGNPMLFELGVAAACESLASRLMENHPIQIQCDIRDSFKNLEPEVKVILFQVVREMLNNVVKHSKAQHAAVLVHWEDERIRAMVKDDGLGFDPKSIGAPTSEGGFGLFSIRERLMSFRGDLQIESTPGAGTIVTATVPARLKREFRTESTAF